jgi:iron(III) transport system ATP-binding protein
MLRIHDLCVRYGNRVAVQGFSLSLAAGEIVTLVGPTGCGKSSVLRAVAGLEPVSAGEIDIDGLHIDRRHPVPPEKRRTGLVFQDFALFPHLTVEQNVGFRVRDRAQVDRWIAKLGLDGHRRAMPGTLSGGQAQRVALARALAHEPALVLLDEPLSNLDAALKSHLRWEIRDALKGAGVPALWVTHDQDEALSVGDRVGVMNQGRLEQVGEPEQCYRAPATRFVARFLGDGVFLRGCLASGQVHTPLGPASLAAPDAAARCARDGEVDVLVRPHDLGLEPACDGNARILWGRYEGETRLYVIRLDGGLDLHARVSHELRLGEGQRVQASIAARHPLPAFAPE